MILLDLNQVAIASLMITLNKGDTASLNLLRHVVLNSIRANRVKFYGTYGEMVVCCDAKKSWRHDLFPYYKKTRRKERGTSAVDWQLVYGFIDLLKDELRENLPYKVIEVANAEADDVISVLAKKAQDHVMIVSSDKDFRQLQVATNIKQFDPIRKKHIVEPDPAAFLKTHIMRGDASDGIPNFLSSDASLVDSNLRQKPIRQSQIETWLANDPKHFCDDAMLRGWKRNESLIDLRNTPSAIVEEIVYTYEAFVPADRKRILPYLVENGLRQLTASVTEF